MTDNQLYELCQRCGREARKWKNKFISLLPEVYRRRLYRKKGFCSIHEFAAKVGGVSYGVVDETLRIDEKLKDKPALLEIIPEVGISKLRTVAGVATKKTAKIWAKRTKTMSRAALETLIRDTRQDQENKIINSQKIPGDGREKFSMNLDPKTIFQLKLIKQKLEKERGETLCWDEVIKMAAEKLLVEKPVRKYKTRPSKSRPVPAKKRRKLPKKCSVPCCNKLATEIHHPDRYALTKSHDRLAPMCKPHHELAHHGHLDEQNDFKTLIHPIINPIKQFVDQKMLAHLRGT
jgi:hypothetical protein